MLSRIGAHHQGDGRLHHGLCAYEARSCSTDGSSGSTKSLAWSCGCTNSCSNSAASSPTSPSGRRRAAGPCGRYGTEWVEVALRDPRRGREWDCLCLDVVLDSAGGGWGMLDGVPGTVVGEKEGEDWEAAYLLVRTNVPYGIQALAAFDPTTR